MSTWTSRLENPVSARLRDPAFTGYVAILLAAFAAFLAIPPIEARTKTWPIVVGFFAVAFGIFTATRGRRRLGYGAVFAGLLGIGLGILATYSSTGNLNAVFDAKTLQGANWQGNPASTFGEFVDSLIAWYPYSGDRRAIAAVQEMLDYQLAHGTTPARWSWSRVPFATSCAGHRKFGRCLGNSPAALMAFSRSLRQLWRLIDVPHRSVPDASFSRLAGGTA